MGDREKLLEGLLMEWLTDRMQEYSGLTPGYDPDFVSRTAEALGFSRDSMDWTDEDLMKVSMARLPRES